MQFLNFNGKVISGSENLIHPDNRSFRYGEGLFETIRLHKGALPLWQFHWQRFSNSFPKIYFDLPPHFSAEHLKEQILQLALKNKVLNGCRVRLTFFKGEGGLWETPSSQFNYIIQCWPVENHQIELNENGLDVGVFNGGKKSCDSLANLKSSNYLLYAVAAQFAKFQKWNDILILNQYHRICDTTIANLFFIKEGVVFTPALSEGCVAGVMRRYLLEAFENNGQRYAEGNYEIAHLLDADEVFLTNAFYGLKWVKRFQNKQYHPKIASGIFREVIAPAFS